MIIWPHKTTMCMYILCYYIILCLLVKRRREVTAEEKGNNILLVLMNNCYLKVMSADTGSLLKSIFLSTITKYRSVHMPCACTQIPYLLLYLWDNIFMNFTNYRDFVKIKLWIPQFNVLYVGYSRSNLANLVKIESWSIFLMNTVQNINLVYKRACVVLSMYVSTYYTYVCI